MIVIHQKGKINVLVFIEFIAVTDSVIYRFRYSNHNVTIDIVFDLEFIFRVINKALYDADVLNNGWNLNFNLIHIFWGVGISSNMVLISSSCQVSESIR